MVDDDKYLMEDMNNFDDIEDIDREEDGFDEMNNFDDPEDIFDKEEEDIFDKEEEDIFDKEEEDIFDEFDNLEEAEVARLVAEAEQFMGEGIDID